MRINIECTTVNAQRAANIAEILQILLKSQHTHCERKVKACQNAFAHLSKQSSICSEGSQLEEIKQKNQQITSMHRRTAAFKGLVLTWILHRS